MRQSLGLARITAVLIAFAFSLATALAFAVVAGIPASPQAAAQETTSGGQSDSGASAPGTDAPDLDVKAWALVDQKTGRYLAGKNPDKRLATGSTTKIMSALVALEGDTKLDEKALVTKKAESFVGGPYSNAGLRWGEYLSVRELLTATLVASGTDAVYALAQHIGGTVDGFVRKMNDKADEMDLKNTHFANPAGLDDPEHYSSARDLATMAREAMKNETFSKMVGTGITSITADNETLGEREIKLFTTNELLSTYPPATGVKTGTTKKAGSSLVASAEKDGESYIAVVLGAKSTEARDQAAREILDYGFDSFEQKTLVSQGKSYKEMSAPYRRGDSVKLIAAEKVSGLVAPGSDVERKVSAGELPDEANGGQKVGKVKVLVDGQSIGSSPLEVNKGYEKASLLDKAWYTVSGIF